MFCVKLKLMRTGWKLKHFLVKWYPTEVCKTELCLWISGNNILSLLCIFWPLILLTILISKWFQINVFSIKWVLCGDDMLFECCLKVFTSCNIGSKFLRRVECFCLCSFMFDIFLLSLQAADEGMQVYMFKSKTVHFWVVTKYVSQNIQCSCYNNEQKSLGLAP